MPSLPPGCLILRTYFGDDAAWVRLKAAAAEPDGDSGYVPIVDYVDDPLYEGMSAAELRTQNSQLPDGPMVTFIADERAQHAEGWPLLAVWVSPPGPELDSGDYAPFRVIASELGAVEANINLANLDWDDFADAVDEDGVYRGFDTAEPDVARDRRKWEHTEFQVVVDRVLDAGNHPARGAQRADAVLADVTVDVPKRMALRRWRDVDSAWIYEGVNPTGRAPNTYRLRHAAPVWGQDTLSLIIQYLDSDASDQVLFRVSYLRTKKTPERNWDEPLDEPRLLSVTVSEVDDGHTRSVIRQDTCPEPLIEPLSELWTTLTHRLDI